MSDDEWSWLVWANEGENLYSVCFHDGDDLEADHVCGFTVEGNDKAERLVELLNKYEVKP